jgi:hypothetical protein
VGSKFSRKVQFSPQTFQIIPIWSLNLLQSNFVIQSSFLLFLERERERLPDFSVEKESWPHHF